MNSSNILICSSVAMRQWFISLMPATRFQLSGEGYRLMMEGRIELLRYVREQSICTNYHRYGNLGERVPEFE